MPLIIKIYTEIASVDSESSSVAWKESYLELNETQKGKITVQNEESSPWIDENGHLLVQGEDGALYRVTYDVSGKPQVSKAGVEGGKLTWFHSNAEYLKKLGGWASYPTVVKRWQQWRSTQEFIHKISDYLETIRVRQADGSQRVQLIGGGAEAEAEADFLQFNQRLLARYQAKVCTELSAILASHSSAQEDALRSKLEEYLAQNWALVKGTKLGYTALAVHPVTEVLIRIAEQLAEGSDRAAIEFLMPGVRFESDVELYPSLRAIPLRQVLKTHILNHRYRYLVPLSLSVTKSRYLNIGGCQGYYNPYYDGLEDEDQSNMVVTSDEWERLWHHSELTRHLHDAEERYDAVANNQDTFLGQLNLLCKSFFVYGAHDGIGHEDNAAGGAYPALLHFFGYYDLVDKKSVPEAIKEALETLRTQLHSYNSIEREGGKTCIANHRSELLLLIQRHQEALNQITLDSNKKGLELSNVLSGVNNCRNALQAALDNNNYVGMDALGVNLELLQELGVPLRIESEKDLACFRFFSVKEIESLLTNNRELCEDIVQQLNSVESLVWFIHGAPVAQVKAMLVALGERLQSRLHLEDTRNLQALLISLAPEKVTAVCEAMKNSNIALRCPQLFTEPTHLQAVLAALPEKDHLAALNQRGMYGETVLHKAAVVPEYLKMLLDLYPEESRLAALNMRDEQGATVLDKSNPESIVAVLVALPEKDRLAALNQRGMYGETVLHKAAGVPECLKMLLDLYPEESRLAAVNMRDEQGATVLDRSNPESIVAVLAALPAKDRLAAVMYGKTALHKAAGVPECLKMLLDLYPEESRLAAVNMRDGRGATVLDRSNLESIVAVLAALPEKDRLAALNQSDMYGKTVLHKAAGVPECLKMLLDLYPEESRLAALNMRNEQGVTVLDRSNPESIVAVLAALPEKDRLAALTQRDMYGKTVLHRMANNPEFLPALLAALPEKYRLAAVNKKDTYYTCTFLYWIAVSKPEFMPVILELLPEKDRLAAVIEKDEYGRQVLYYVADKPELAQAVLGLLPKEDRLTAVNEKNNEGKTLLHQVVDKPECVQAILKNLSETEKKLVELQAAVYKAVCKYLLQRRSTDRKSDAGFFTKIRGDKGLTRAKELQENILDATTEEAAQKIITQFLKGYIFFGEKYDNHSCASFLIDEMAKLDNSPGKDSRNTSRLK